MHSWWKSSSKDVKKKAKKTSKGTIIEALQRKLKIPFEDKNNNRSDTSRRPNSEAVSTKGSLSQVVSRSSSPSTHVSRCQSFAERTSVQPLPLPLNHHAGIGRSSSGLNVSKPGLGRCGKPRLHIPLPKPDKFSPGAVAIDIDGDLPTASVSSDYSVDSDDLNDSRLPSPRGHDFENEIINVANCPLRGRDKSLPEIEIGLLTVSERSCHNLGRMHKDQSLIMSNSKETPRPAMMLFNSQSLSSSPKRGNLGAHLSPLQINRSALGIGSAPDSSMSSPSRSPMRIICPEHITSSAFLSSKAYPDPCFLGSCPCSSPGSGHNSGHNSMGGDLSSQFFWQQTRGGPECSPIPSPRMTSPGPSSRIHSGAVTPLHPRAGGPSTEPPIGWSDDGKQQSHRLPLPPTSIVNSSPFNHANTTVTASVPKSPGRSDTPAGIGSRWKKGRLIGRGTFGHVYVGFNSESGEMCAMKEVTLLSDDPKSKESARHLMQEIALLSMYRHPNIVQYYGSETIDDKLYVYLEYVSGGSIHKLLEEYGQLGELAIRNYTQQILSGLAYLHAKNTVHRDIKGANILVDPNGRVKLADFGMAKHITGQSSPLSFKGSPYWMAPEVIKNSNGCNLAVDVWSLGCTVLEMATTKPPWSQYEGVAAMFKIGNSKELPPIPDYLSDMCKDFVMQCLQRNPQHRPTAAQLLEHPFVKSTLPLARHMPSHEPLESLSGMSNGMRLMGTNNARNLSSMEVEVVSVNQSRGGRICASSTDIHIPRSVTCPVSPSGSPLLNQRSPQHINGRMSPSPISSPRTTSGSSTPLSGGNGALPFSLVKQSVFLTDGSSNLPRSPNNFHINSSGYQDQSPYLFRPQSRVFHELKPSDNDTLGKPFGTGAQGEANDGQSVLIDRVSHQHLWGNAKLSPLDFGPGSPALGGLIGM